MKRITRSETKIQMYICRGGIGVAVCDLCKTTRYGLEMHELIARSVTQNNPEARELSFQEELCSLLDKTCHEEADTTKVQDLLWERNQRRYGQKFWEAFDRVQKVMVTPIPTYGLSREDTPIYGTTTLWPNGNELASG